MCKENIDNIHPAGKKNVEKTVADMDVQYACSLSYKNSSFDSLHI